MNNNRYLTENLNFLILNFEVNFFTREKRALHCPKKKTNKFSALIFRKILYCYPTKKDHNCFPDDANNKSGKKLYEKKFHNENGNNNNNFSEKTF